MKTKTLLTSLAMILSTTSIQAFIEMDFVSGGTPMDPRTIQMCIEEDSYIHFQTIGSSNNTDGELPTWTVSDDVYGYGDNFYFVPPSTTPASYTVNLYDGLLINDTIDNQGAPRVDRMTVNVISCN